MSSLWWCQLHVWMCEDLHLGLRCRNLSVFSTPGLSRRSSRASRMFTMSNSPPKVPQPERLDQVYEALKKGLQWVLHLFSFYSERVNVSQCCWLFTSSSSRGLLSSIMTCKHFMEMINGCALRSYLHVHQLELDSLSRQIKDSKRNSRLVRDALFLVWDCWHAADFVFSVPQGFLYELDKVSCSEHLSSFYSSW